MSVGIPIKLLHEASPHIVTVEMRVGDVYRGTLLTVEDNMNVQLKRVTVMRRDGKVSHLEHVFIRGSKVRFFILPDILSCVPMFKRVEALKDGRPVEARGLGRGREVGSGAGRAAAARAAGVARGYVQKRLDVSTGHKLAVYEWEPECGAAAARGVLFLLHGVLAHAKFEFLAFGGQPINVPSDTGSSTLAVPMKQCSTFPAGDHRLDFDTAQGEALIFFCSANLCVRNACATSCVDASPPPHTANVL